MCVCSPTRAKNLKKKNNHSLRRIVAVRIHRYRSKWCIYRARHARTTFVIILCKSFHSYARNYSHQTITRYITLNGRVTSVLISCCNYTTSLTYSQRAKIVHECITCVMTTLRPHLGLYKIIIIYPFSGGSRRLRTF